MAWIKKLTSVVLLALASSASCVPKTGVSRHHAYAVNGTMMFVGGVVGLPAVGLTVAGEGSHGAGQAMLLGLPLLLAGSLGVLLTTAGVTCDADNKAAACLD